MWAPNRITGIFDARRAAQAAATGEKSP